MIGQSKGDKSEYFEKLPIDSGMGHSGKWYILIISQLKTL